MENKKPQSPQQPPIQGGLMLEVAMGATVADKVMTESQIKKG